MLEKFVPVRTLEYFDGIDGFEIPDKSIFNEFYIK